MTYAQLDVDFFRGLATPAREFGVKPTLKWIPLDDLVIDPSYQRETKRAGKKIVLSIAENFCWSKFGACLVADASAGKYAIVDGQHRTIGAALCGIDKVPCLVIPADLREQASAFAAINSCRTAMTPLQLHAAKVHAGDPDARAIDAVCRQAGVCVVRYPVPAKILKPGETLAIGALTKAIKGYGRAVLAAALNAIVKTGAAAALRSCNILALCAVLDDEIDWRGADLIGAMRGFDFDRQYLKAMIANRKTGRPVIACMAALIKEHLEQAYGIEDAA